mmetsp:Transcript_38867/g.91491  ORF Transcript_38867/g.91491 Transcript_38867/m.91491 type:complete len:776 (-) Transcript_38867:167-2494(-)
MLQSSLADCLRGPGIRLESDSDIDVEEEAGAYPLIKVENEENFLCTFYYMERRRWERQMAGRIRSNAGDVLTKVCWTIILLAAILVVFFGVLEHRQEPQLIIESHQCYRVQERVQDADGPHDCLLHALWKSACSKSTPVVMFDPSNNTCLCCDIPAPSEPEVGDFNADWDLYRWRQNYTHSESDTIDTLSLILAIVMTIFFMATLIYMVRTKDNPWTQFFLWMSAIFAVWYVTAPFYDTARTCTTGVTEGVCIYVSRAIIGIIWACLMLLTGVLYLALTWARSWWVNMLLTKEIGASWWWQCRRQGPGHYSYKPNGIFSCSRNIFSYRGAVDAGGRPCGRGEWSDDSYHGEVLEGIWQDGLPKGKFRAMEYGTGAQFGQRPVGYFSAREDSVPGDLHTLACGIKKSDFPYVGVCQVELSIAGGFFPFLPKVRHETEQTSVVEMIREFKEQDSHSINWKHDPRPSADKYEEVLVHIHGWGTDLGLQLEKIALLLSLGKCWPHIKPVVFGWSCGQVPAYFTIKDHSTDYVDDLITFFNQLEKEFEVVHVLCHSAGAELWCHVFPYIKHCFTKANRNGNGAKPVKNDGQLDLANVILMNGDVTVEKLAETLPEMMEYACRFTCYNDTKDVATAASTWVQRLMPRPLQAGWRDPELDSRTQTWGRVVSPIWLEPNARTGAMELHGIKIDAYMPDDYASHYEKCPHQHGAVDEYLDVIDCSFIDYNAGFSRHNYYALNSLMGEDICECISQRKSAQERSHLARRKGNVYDFLAAPKALSA